MAKIDVTRLGSSVPFTFDRGDDAVTNWVCTIYVKQYPEDTASVTRVIPLDADNKWTGFLTATETAALANGLWYLTGKLTNTTTDEAEEIAQGSVRFSVSGTWVA